MNPLTWIDGILRDLRHAFRTIRTKPGFSIAALASLALGIGANTAIFGVVNAVLIRPLAYPEPEALVRVFNTAVFQQEAFDNMGLSPGIYDAFRRNARTLDEFGVWVPGAATVTGVGEPEQIAAVTVTQGVLPALGVPPHLGRWFSEQEDAEGADPTAILSHGYWRRKFGGDPQILGRTVLVDSVPRQVIGVMPAGFEFLDLAPDVLLPQRFASSGLRPDVFSYSGLARLRPGVTLAAANADLARVLANWADTEGARKMVDQLRMRPDVRPLKQEIVGHVGAVLGVLMGALGLTLLLVCANVANLVLVRAQARRQEFAVRSALGAGRGRIARELLVESLTLSVLGGAVGAVVAYGGLRLLVANAPAGLPRLGEISMDAATLAFALVCSLACGLLFGLAAILQSGTTSRTQGARGATQGRRQLRTQNVLVVTQVALALVLLVASGLMIRTALALQGVTPGFTEPERIQTVRLSIPEAQVPEPEQVIRMQAGILERLAAVPGVEAAGFANGLPMETEYRNGVVVAVEGKTPPDEVPPNRTSKQVSPGLLSAQGTRLVAGRDFTWEDVFERRPVALVSENMARENWGEPGAALGKRIRAGRRGPWIEVVGVAENVREHGADRPAPATVYWRAGLQAESVRRSLTFAMRSGRAASEGFVREVAAAVHSVNPNLPLAKVRTLDDVYRLSTARTYFALVLLVIAGAMALALALIGVYGVLAYALAQRRREVSIRLALGAEPRAVRSSFVRQGLALAAVGGVVGLASAAGLSRWIASLLFGVTPLDPLTYALAAAWIAATAAIASYLPARKAAALDPAEALRSD